MTALARRMTGPPGRRAPWRCEPTSPIRPTESGWWPRPWHAFGTLNGAVNCAGISSGLSVPLAQTPLETWRAVMSVNLDGVFYSMRAELPAIAAAGGGSIVNIASIMGVVGSAPVGRLHGG